MAAQNKLVDLAAVFSCRARAAWPGFLALGRSRHTPRPVTDGDLRQQKRRRDVRLCSPRFSETKTYVAGMYLSFRVPDISGYNFPR